jgi:hypothetical protein
MQYCKTNCCLGSDDAVLQNELLSRKRRCRTAKTLCCSVNPYYPRIMTPRIQALSGPLEGTASFRDEKDVSPNSDRTGSEARDYKS